jgi:hypothetical protein
MWFFQQLTTACKPRWTRRLAQAIDTGEML